jgi:hypothetical protein
MSGLGCGPPSIDRSGQRPVQPNSTGQACVQGQARLRTHRDRACALLEMHGYDPASALAIPFPANLAFDPLATPLTPWRALASLTPFGTQSARHGSYPGTFSSASASFRGLYFSRTREPDVRVLARRSDEDAEQMGSNQSALARYRTEMLLVYIYPE